jgi:uncharacterized membrane protein
MRLVRFWRHALLPDWWLRRAWLKSTLRAIEAAITASERVHQGELRFVAEASLPLGGLLRGETTRERAIELFARLGVWDTEHNSGALIYVRLIDRRDEIVADRGIHARVDETFWRLVCRRMETAFAQGRFEEGTMLALNDITTVLAGHFPATGDNPDELSNTSLLL